MQRTNRRIVLKSQPVGLPTPENFRLDERGVPSLSDGEVLVRTLYLSVDPSMRGRMGDAKSCIPPVRIGEVMVGATVARVEESRSPKFKKGDLVNAWSGWQDYHVSDWHGITRVDDRVSPPTLALGVLGAPGFTAYVGLLDIGQPRPGETVVVSAATGGVGAVVGQIAKLKGCHVVGVAGGPVKCGYAVNELGYDACLDRHAVDLPAQLAASCPQGVDVYFESVGGVVFDAVMALLNARARIPVCGLVSRYNDTGLPPGPDRLGLLSSLLLTKRIKMQGFDASEEYSLRRGEFMNQMTSWVKEGHVKSREDVVEGLEMAPQAFIGLLEGKNFGKQLIRVAPC